MEEIQKYNESKVQIFDFEKLINESVSKDKIKNFQEEVEKAKNKNKSPMDYNYIPADVVEDELDTFFMSDWNTVKVRYSLVLNTIMCKLYLKVYHPVLKKYIYRHGSGGCQLQLKKGEKEITPYTLNNKAVEKAHEIAHTLAIKSAAKHLGKRFGRSLNREENKFETLEEFLQNKEQEFYRNNLISEALEFLALDTEKQSKFDSYSKQFQKAPNSQLERYINEQKSKQNENKGI